MVLHFSAVVVVTLRAHAKLVTLFSPLPAQLGHQRSVLSLRLTYQVSHSTAMMLLTRLLGRQDEKGKGKGDHHLKRVQKEREREEAPRLFGSTHPMFQGRQGLLALSM